MAVGGLLGRSRGTSRALGSSIGLESSIGSSGTSTPTDWGRIALLTGVALVFLFFGDIVNFLKVLLVWIADFAMRIIQGFSGFAWSLVLVVRAEVPSLLSNMKVWLIHTANLVQRAVESPWFPGAVLLVCGFFVCFCTLGWIIGGCKWVLKALNCPCYMTKMACTQLCACWTATWLRIYDYIGLIIRLFSTLAFFFVQPFKAAAAEGFARYERIELKRARREAKFMGRYQELKDTPLDPDIEVIEDELTIWQLIQAPSGKAEVTSEHQTFWEIFSKPLASPPGSPTPEKKGGELTLRTSVLASNMEPPQQRDQKATSRPCIAPLGAGLMERPRGVPPPVSAATSHRDPLELHAAARTDAYGRRNKPHQSHRARLPPGAVKKALELEAKISMRERRLLMVYEDKCNKKEAEKQLEEEMSHRERQLAYYRTPFNARARGKDAMYRRAEALYSEERVLWSREREAIYGKVAVGSALAAFAPSWNDPHDQSASHQYDDEDFEA